MGSKASKVTHHSGAVAKSKKTSTHSKGAVSYQRINAQGIQNVLVIWLDNHINENSADCHNTITQLQRAIISVNTFTNVDDCIQFLKNMDNEKACMIISGSLGQHIMPRVHSMIQVDSIFIFCGDRQYHEQWAKDWVKIKGVFTKIAPICEALKQAAQQCEQNAISISFIETSGDLSKKNLDQLDPTFMYTQILKEILLTIKFEQKHFQEFIRYCRGAVGENEKELKNVENLAEKYYDQTAIWWYTCECFLYPMLNRALRLMDVDVIINMGFFISDLHHHIEQLYSIQFPDRHSKKSFTVYRGQGMSNTEFEKMSNTKNGLIAFNNFLSTSENRDTSLNFAHRAASNPDLVGILFVMSINPIESTAPFASIADVSYYKDEEKEVLFAMHTVFRIGEITPMDEYHRLFRVDLTLTSDSDQDLRVLTSYLREETFPNSTGWYRLSIVLLRIGQPEKALQVCQILLEQETEESGKALIYNQIGRAKSNQGKYEEALTFFEKSIEIDQNITPTDHCNLAASYKNIGKVYLKMGNYSKALSSQEKALAIRQQSLPPNHSDLGKSYNEIGIVCYKMGDYSRALSSYEKSLEIRVQSLPSNHPYLAALCNNIGNVYCNMGEYSKALPFYERAIKIGQQSLPSNHLHLQMFRKNLEDAKKKF